MTTTETPIRTRAAAARSVGSIIDTMWAAREEKKRLEAEAEEVAKKITAMEEELSAVMAEQGLDKAAGKLASVSFTFSTVGQIQGDAGWDDFCKYVKKTGYFHLLSRRVVDSAYRELLGSGKKVPGVEPFTKKRVNLRTL